MVPSRSSSVSPFALRSRTHLEFTHTCAGSRWGGGFFPLWTPNRANTIDGKTIVCFLAEPQWGLRRARVTLLLGPSLWFVVRWSSSETYHGLRGRSQTKTDFAPRGWRPSQASVRGHPWLRRATHWALGERDDVLCPSHPCGVGPILQTKKLKLIGGKRSA